MNSITDRKALLEASLIATITCFFAIGILYIPALFLLIFLIPVPFIVIATRHNIRYALFSLIISSLLIGFITEVFFTLLILLFFGPLSLIMGYLIKKNYNELTVIGIGSMVSIITVFFTLHIISIVGGFHFVDQFALLINEAIEQQMETLISMNVEVADLNNFFSYLLMIFPSFLIIQSIIVSFINYYCAISILKRLRFSSHTLPEFSNFKLPSNIVLGTFIILSLSYFTSFIQGIQSESLIINVLVIFMFIFFVQGVAFLSFFLKKRGVKKPIRILLLALMLLISPLLVFVSMLGFMDSLVDMRKIRHKK